MFARSIFSTFFEKMFGLSVGNRIILKSDQFFLGHGNGGGGGLGRGWV